MIFNNMQRFPKRQTGVVLIVVILAIVLMVTLLAIMIEDQHIFIRRQGINIHKV